MRSSDRSGDSTHRGDDAALACRRFWLSRGTAPDLSDNGFLLDPDSPRAVYARTWAVPFEVLANIPVLGLLGEPGIGKTTVLKQETLRLTAALQDSADRVLQVDPAAYASDGLACQTIFRSRQFRAWKKGRGRLHLLLDGFDTCLRHVEPLVALLLARFEQESLDRLSPRIACRRAEWPEDLEAGLRRLWPETTHAQSERAVEVVELAPLRKIEVCAIAEASGVGGEEFLKEVERVGAHQLANRPSALRFLLSSFRNHRELPSRKTDLYREGCLVLCDEVREDLRRKSQTQKLSSGLRFAVAGRLAAVSAFSRRTGIWSASRGNPTPEGDIRREELCGRKERFERQVSNVKENAIREAMDTGLFRSLGPHRLGFSHQVYAEYLAAQYLVDHQLPVPAILRLILHPDGSGAVVPQLRETAAWLSHQYLVGSCRDDTKDSANAL
jgi:hypothetical protein